MSNDLESDDFETIDNSDNSYLSGEDDNHDNLDDSDPDNLDDPDPDDPANDPGNKPEQQTKDPGFKKKKPIKTKKMPIRDAIKTVDERSLYTKIDRFFKSECTNEQICKMIKIINNEDSVSLRLLNWFAMKHSATMESLEIINSTGNVELFDVKISYRARLNTHSKKYFDPFRRGKRFDYPYDINDKDKVVETTLCQLNFFRWLYLHELMDYVEEHFDELKQKMGSYNNVEKKKKETKKEKEKIKKTIIKNKKEDMRIKVKRFTEDNTSKLVIII
jgi:hypothetical protein